MILGTHSALPDNTHTNAAEACKFVTQVSCRFPLLNSNDDTNI